MNKMCKDCLCLNVDCAGTNNTNWTGCIYRKTAAKERNEEISKDEVYNLIEKLRRNIT